MDLFNLFIISCSQDEATWLAFYKDTINGETKYIFLSAGSSLKGQSDRDKFEAARKLNQYIGSLRKTVSSLSNSDQMSQSKPDSGLGLSHFQYESLYPNDTNEYHR